MIPSDHFVRFYNEVFKYLDKLPGNELNKYWLEISRLQEHSCLETFKKDGLRGMYEYWERIRIEENCVMDLILNDDYLLLTMNKCPSLSKVLDNDASRCDKYCDHCMGWIGPLLTKCSYYAVSDIHARNIPTCKLWIFTDKEQAMNHKKQLDNSNNTILSNF